MDASLFEWINGLTQRTTWANGVAAWYADNGIVLFAILLLVGYLLARHRDDAHGVAGSIWAGAAALVALGLGQIIGNLVDRARPYETLSDVHVLIARTTDFSFPSDHATTVGAVAVGLLFVDRRLGIVASAAGILMAITRVYVGAHYPLDVLAGLVLGGGVAAAGAIWVVPALQRIVERIARTPAALLVVAHPARRT